LDISVALVQAEIEELRSASPKGLYLAGFSQGAMLTAATLSRTPGAIDGAVMFSGAWPLGPTASIEPPAPRCLVQHGTHDPVVQLAWAERSRDALLAGGWPVQWQVYPIEHSAVIEEIVAVGQFITKELA
jgi:phospholipase/carboxylesterase